MSLYSVLIGQKEYQINITPEKSTVNGKQLDVELVSLNNNGLHLLKQGDQALEIYLSESKKGILAVQVGRQTLEAKVENFQQRIRRGTAKTTDGDLNAPMPGVVIDVLVEQGQDVSQGDTLVLLESMKMQMQMRSPVAGHVNRIAVDAGQEVEKGALLISISQNELEE
ncbi:MAG: acetyl-CoA carboxylase biotin carboxyl carrier protein subunit [Anaerolineaceae bacterium]|nr:acetyl-CoA carboxylase biotin carboxyl carrier protein subunit [Anaerolineaceae bacterium]